MDKETIRENAHRTKDEVKDNLKKAKKTKVLLSILKLTVLFAIVVAIPVYVYFFQKDFLAQFKSFDDIIVFLRYYEMESIFVYIGIQVLQIVISVIPGQAFQFAAGYLYGFIPGLLFSCVGAVVGTTISFYLAKLLGKDAVHLFFGEERMAYFLDRLNSKRAYTIVFLLYVIPGLPKDVVSYAAGVSEMKFKPFLILSLLGRIPGMAGSLLIGAFYMKKHYIGMAVVAALAVIAFILCIIYRKKINKYLDRFYDKITR
ncbi:TVP38/TMEM64 family protein [Ihubacter sp. rT4E-8]|uniref:TVP38/TMEM64 family protein n=1 Tax=unclassified Ihubacter TaxID=2633299 RepID=UPI00137AF546